jgi:MoaA/NifB/PqqE/SkfB family radical SAM enzyme
MDKVQIVSWILTRKCNLKCSYCAITRNYKGLPDKYPDMKYYYENEMSTETVIKILMRLKLHNPDCFHILYGGEPLLRKDLPHIINFCNENDINYTIITNNSDEVQPMMEDLMLKTDYVTGLTSSVDPLVITDEFDDDRVKKSVAGFSRLNKYRGMVKDIVAEITVDNRNVKHLYDLVAMLTKAGVNSDITFIDIAKNPYYDFSNVTDDALLVSNTPEVQDQINRIIEDKLDVHMAKTLLPKIISDLPSNMDCGIEKDLHNLTIDADGSVRLCLRIRGISTPRLQMLDMIGESGLILSKIIRDFITIDKANFCRKCNWTCMRMSQLLSSGKDKIDNLVHSDRRDT